MFYVVPTQYVQVKPLEKKMGEEDVPLSLLVSKVSDVLCQR